MSMTFYQEDINPPVVDPGSIDLPPTQPIDMTTFLTDRLSSGPDAEDRSIPSTAPLARNNSSAPL
jgi:hypothetical protein